MAIEKISKRQRRKTSFLPISAEKLIELRLAGLTFQSIADLCETNKSLVYTTYMDLKDANYNNLEPIQIASLKAKLATDALYSDIARDYGLQLKGLLNYLSDRDLHRQLDIDTIFRLKASGARVNTICDYYGITRNTLRTFMQSHEISK